MTVRLCDVTDKIKNESTHKAQIWYNDCQYPAFVRAHYNNGFSQSQVVPFSSSALGVDGCLLPTLNGIYQCRHVYRMTAGLSLPPTADSYGHGLPKVYSIHRIPPHVWEIGSLLQQDSDVQQSPITDLRQHDLFLGEAPDGC